MTRYSILVTLAIALRANGQTLYEALSKIPELSYFTAFYANNRVFADAYFGNSMVYPITFLAPNNDAFTALQEHYGVNLTSLAVDSLLEIVQYHTLVSGLTASDFDNDGAEGITVPTLLNNAVNNNRTVGAALAARFGGLQKASGQVVFIKGEDTGAARFRLMSRQNGEEQPPNTVRSGLSSNVEITTLDGEEGAWDGGRFHIVDGFLTPPTTCMATIRDAGLTNLDRALNRTNLWPALDGSKNVTCLGPNDAAFVDAGSPDIAFNSTILSQAILFHTLPEVAYSDYLYDGQEFKSLQNATVRVRVVGEGGDKEIYFNNAKVIDANVLTHNGLMHVLDAVMLPLEQINPTAPSGQPTPTATPMATPTGSNSSASAPVSTGAAVSLKLNSESMWTFWTLVTSLFLMA